MSKRLVNPKVLDAKKPAKETRSPFGMMPDDMRADAEARARGLKPDGIPRLPRMH